MEITEKIIDIQSGDEKIIERVETASEKLERETIEAELIKEQKIRNEKLIARAALLERLGITEEEAQLLFR